MRPLGQTLYKMCRFVTLVAFLSLMCGPVSYAGTAEQYFRSGSDSMPIGYLNGSFQDAGDASSEGSEEEGFFEKAIDYVKSKFDQAREETSSDTNASDLTKDVNTGQVTDQNLAYIRSIEANVASILEAEKAYLENFELAGNAEVANLVMLKEDVITEHEKELADIIQSGSSAIEAREGEIAVLEAQKSAKEAELKAARDDLAATEAKAEKELGTITKGMTGGMIANFENEHAEAVTAKEDTIATLERELIDLINSRQIAIGMLESAHNNMTEEMSNAGAELEYRIASVEDAESLIADEFYALKESREVTLAELKGELEGLEKSINDIMAKLAALYPEGAENPVLKKYAYALFAKLTLPTEEKRNEPYYYRAGGYNKGPIADISLSSKYKLPVSGEKIKDISTGVLQGKNRVSVEGVNEAIDAARRIGKSGVHTALPTVYIRRETVRKAAKPDDVKIASTFANTLKTPTQDTKALLDADNRTLAVDEQEKLRKADNIELKQASIDFIQRVVNVIRTNEKMRGVIKEEDLSKIKRVFSKFDREKTKAFSDYQASSTPYYNNMTQVFADNMAVLQIKGLLSKDLTETELSKLSPERINKIMEKIRRVKDKTYTEERILQQEAKHREEILTPAKREFEENIETVLEDFNQWLSGVLE